ncbi:MAG TPA: TonB-dependent receptor [Thermoanaerobaculia bacterium]|jgi:outer membrane receptor protein involved in Fe transport|nr:TonB-dependent receptor [Thermoanaerobaculia bacterium]
MLLAVALLLAQTSETITVTATRTETRIADTPASVVVLSQETLQTSAAPTLDDALRQVAGFTLFRRTGSRVANPTAQGVSLRGVGASGASRALVLDDGIPLNDPFGGWVYWGRVPRVALDRVEVLRGGASDLYGSSAMGGVIQFVRRKSSGVDVETSVGSQETGTASLFAAGARGEWNGNVAADFLSTAGYVLVRDDQRGTVDVEADSRHMTLDATLRRGGMFVRASHYRDARNNGTPMQENDTTIRHLAIGGDAALFGGTLALRAYGSDQDYFQTFSAIDADRNGERLTVEQRVPSRGIGGSAQYTHAWGQRQVLVGGVEIRDAEGVSDELRFTPNGTFRVEAGGRQRTGAVYLEDLIAVSANVAIMAGIRGDTFRSEDTKAAAAAAALQTVLNPRLSVLWRVADALSISASAYTAFRAPTLNELYRGFRVGNVETLPNAALTSEELTGFEVGARARNARVTLFLMNVTDTIANVTLSQTPALITRQRQNLGRTRSIGAELDAEWHFGRDVRTSAGLLFVDATVRDGVLRGKRVPQVPRLQATAQAMWKRIGAQVRWSTSQFDDDRNELPLDGYAVLDLLASHPITQAVEMTFALENATNESIEASATPVVTLGQPRAWRIGLRFHRGSRKGSRSHTL